MLSVNFATNLGIFRTFMEAGREDVYIKEGYEPFVDAIIAAGKIKFNFFIEGVTARYIADSHPTVADKIRRGVELGKIEIGTYSYNHPVLSMIPYIDTFKQMEEGKKIDEEIWGVEPKITMLPEAGWDPSLPEILNDLGIVYLLMGKREIMRDYPDLNRNVFTHPFTVLGIHESKVTALAVDASDWAEGEQAFYIEGAIVQDAEQNLREFNARIDQLLGGENTGNRIMVCKNDAEFVYEGTMKALHGRPGDRQGFYSRMGESLGDEPARRAEAMSRAWDKMAERKDIEFVTACEFLDANPPEREFVLRPSFKQHREWLEGSEKVGVILDESRNEIRRAEYALTIAEKLGLDTKEARGEIRRAWMLLLEAEISTGRRACANESGKATRVYKSLELAVEAQRLAEAAVKNL